jgi:hypothetical protein
MTRYEIDRRVIGKHYQTCWTRLSGDVCLFVDTSLLAKNLLLDTPMYVVYRQWTARGVTVPEITTHTTRGRSGRLPQCLNAKKSTAES